MFPFFLDCLRDALCRMQARFFQDSWLFMATDWMICVAW